MDAGPRLRGSPEDGVGGKAWGKLRPSCPAPGAAPGEGADDGGKGGVYWAVRTGEGIALEASVDVGKLVWAQHAEGSTQESSKVAAGIHAHTVRSIDYPTTTEIFDPIRA